MPAPEILSIDPREDFEAYDDPFSYVVENFRGFSRNLRVIDDLPNDSEIYFEEGSAGAAFLSQIRRDTTEKLQRASKVPDELRAKQLALLEADPMASENPETVICIADILFQNGRYKETEDLFYINIDGKRRLKWPHNFACLHLLALIAEQNQNGFKMAELMTDKNGNPLFPDHPGAMRLLIYGLHLSKQKQRIIDILEASPNQEILFKNPSIFADYLIALNHTGQSQKIVERYVVDSQFVVPCPIGAGIAASIGLALNMLHRYRETHAIMKKIPRAREFCGNGKFAGVFTFAANSLGLYDESIEALSNNGRPRFPNNTNCMRNLSYAYIGKGWLREARYLLEWIERNSNIDKRQMDGVWNALSRAQTGRVMRRR